MQDGTVIKHRNAWRLRYYEVQIRDGARKRVRVSKKLASVSAEYPTKRSVLGLAQRALEQINTSQLQPESSLLVTEFIEKFYFPTMEKELRPSTVHNYKVSIYDKHLKHRFGKLRLRDARPVHFQRMMRDISDVGHTTLLHIKNFISGVFEFARRDGVLDTPNPVISVTVPGRRKKFDGAAYTLADVSDMLEAFNNETSQDETARDVIAFLSLTGLRQSECRALRWSDWDENNETLSIQRAVWGKHVGQTKNISSENTIPVLSMVRDLLRYRRDQIKPKPDDYIFAGPKNGAPLDFHNLVNRVIKPRLDPSKVKSNMENPEIRRYIESGVVKPVVNFTGLHGFRRGLATNLFDLGVHPKVIAAILRHSDVSTTMQHYIKERDTETRAALQRLEDSFRKLYS